MAEQRRQFVGLRLLPESLAAARTAADTEGSDVSTVLRRWMALGRAAERAGWTPRPAPAPPPEDRATVETYPKDQAGRKRDRP